MNDNYDKIEEEEKKKLAEESASWRKKRPKVSGKSVFKLEEILKKKSQEENQVESAGENKS